MITLRRSEERGHANFGWLDSRHSFSFARYYDPRFMGHSVLRVINDDWVKPGMGFDTHPHSDMEIISYILQGSIEHKDTMGYHSVLKAGDVQVMSAGTGIMHSEYNPSATEELNFLQLWIKPKQQGVQPQYQQKNFADSEGMTLIVSPDGQQGSLPINQDARIYKVNLHQQAQQIELQPTRSYYLHLARGSMRANDIELSAGDAISLNAENTLSFDNNEQAEALLFDLP